MLLNDFFKITELNANGDGANYKITAELNEKHKIFMGHFPQAPVVPGVCIIQMLKEIASEILKKELALTRGDNIKYCAVINPLTNKIICFDLAVKQQENQSVLLTSKIYFEEIKFCTIKGEFKILDN